MTESIKGASRRSRLTTSDVPMHAPRFARPRVDHGDVGRCVQGVLPGCDSPVFAIRGAHLLSVPCSGAGPVGAAQRDRVPEMSSRRLVTSAPIRPVAKLRVRSLHRLRSYPCRLPSRSDPAPCRLRHDFAHNISRGDAVTPLVPGRASAARRGRTARSHPSARPLRSRDVRWSLRRT